MPSHPPHPEHPPHRAIARKRLLPCLLAAALAPLLSGCSAAILDPAGRIGADEKNLIITATLLMLIVVIPVIVMTLAFAWRYRASNERATYAPNWAHSTKIELIVWIVPCLIIAVLAVLTWRSSHDLDPYKPIESDVRPITVQVVALDWKWLFIYPDLHIATVNELTIPTNVPVNFEITSESVMNAFFIPRLGSQVYAMAGMNTQLRLIADKPGDYDGMSANFSGEGFSDMKFTAKAISPENFEDWAKRIQHSPEALDAARYAELAKPSGKQPVAYFAHVDPSLYGQVVGQYMGAHGAPGMAGMAPNPPPVVAQKSE